MNHLKLKSKREILCQKLNICKYNVLSLGGVTIIRKWLENYIRFRHWAGDHSVGTPQANTCTGRETIKPGTIVALAMPKWLSYWLFYKY